MTTINKNSVSLAGEFAVLSQLALRGYDANMTLGHTKGVDILVSDPNTGRLYQLEVKTNYRRARSKPAVSKIFGRWVSDWMMTKKHEDISTPTLFYCFVNISRDAGAFKFYIVPSNVVARYVREQHRYWLRKKRKGCKKVKNTAMRSFRIGLKGDKCPIATPTVERYEDNWTFRR